MHHSQQSVSIVIERTFFCVCFVVLGNVIKIAGLGRDEGEFLRPDDQYINRAHSGEYDHELYIMEAAREAVVGGVVGALLILLVIVKLTIFKRGSNLPPARTGWIPWIGVAVPFGKEPLYYIEKTRRELGDIFTIHAAGKRMTFITDHEDFHHYFTTTHTNFQSAVQPFTMKAAGVSKESFFAHHTAIHDTIKGRLTPAYTADLCPQLSQEFHSHLVHFNEGEVDLMDFVRDSMFTPVVTKLFGRENLPPSQEELAKLQKTFQKYDEDFEYGAELPEIFLKDWRQCKHSLIAFFKLMVEGMKKTGEPIEAGQEKTVLEHLLGTVDAEHAHNYALLLLWASQANAVPAVFWTLSFILGCPDLYKSLKEEIKKIPWADVKNAFCPLKEESLKSVMSVKRCVLEAVRLRAPGMIPRKVTKTHVVKGYTIPEGHLMMLSPYWSHRDPQRFPDPETFNPDRWLSCDLDKNQFIDGFVGFGGGRYQCPGRWFALMEMHLFVTMALRMFEFELLDPIPQPSPLHLVGIQQPATACRVKVKHLSQPTTKMGACM
eukprot:Em0021g640a